MTKDGSAQAPGSGQGRVLFTEKSVLKHGRLCQYPIGVRKQPSSSGPGVFASCKRPARPTGCRPERERDRHALCSLSLHVEPLWVPNSGTDTPRAFSTKSPPFAHGAPPLCLYLHPSSRSHYLPSRLRSAFCFVSHAHHCCSRRHICDLASGVLRHLFLPVEARQACPGTRSWPAP